MELVRELLKDPAATGLIGVLIGTLAGIAGTWITARAASRHARWELGIRTALAEYEAQLSKAKAGTRFPPPSAYVAVTARLVDRILAADDLSDERVIELIEESHTLSDKLTLHFQGADERRSRQHSHPTRTDSEI